jgi:FO synthase subunit 2
MTTVSALGTDVLGGSCLTQTDAEFLLSARGRDVWRITAAADEMRERRKGDTVTYVKNQNLHVTNICKNLCGVLRVRQERNR